MKAKKQKCIKTRQSPELKKWDFTYRERCIQFGSDETYDPKLERLKQTQRLKVGQNPLLFVIVCQKSMRACAI